jgi:hypothetical protein
MNDDAGPTSTSTSEALTASRVISTWGNCLVLRASNLFRVSGFVLVQFPRVGAFINDSVASYCKEARVHIVPAHRARTRRIRPTLDQPVDDHEHDHHAQREDQPRAAVRRRDFVALLTVIEALPGVVQDARQGARPVEPFR